MQPFEKMPYLTEGRPCYDTGTPISWKFKKEKKKKSRIVDLSCFLCVFINWVWFLGESGDFERSSNFSASPRKKKNSIFSYGETPKNSKIAQNFPAKIIRKAAMWWELPAHVLQALDRGKCSLRLPAWGELDHNFVSLFLHRGKNGRSHVR